MTRTTLATSTEISSAPTEENSASWVNRKATQLAHRAARARQASKRRRLIDPATCDRDYTQAEIEFMQAIQQYKTKSGRMFPTWSEVLEVVQELGYRKTCPCLLPEVND